MSWKSGATAPALLSIPFVAIVASVRAREDASHTLPIPAERVWKDDDGRVIKRVDATGRMFLLAWDAEGRLVRVSGIQKRVDPRRPQGEVPSGEAWSHCFSYDPDGRLALEMDCIGNVHRLDTTVIVDPKRGTLLPNHRHVEEAGTAAAEAPGAERSGATVRFEYDAAGRVLEVSR